TSDSNTLPSGALAPCIRVRSLQVERYFFAARLRVAQCARAFGLSTLGGQGSVRLLRMTHLRLPNPDLERQVLPGALAAQIRGGICDLPAVVRLLAPDQFAHILMRDEFEADAHPAEALNRRAAVLNRPALQQLGSEPVQPLDCLPLLFCEFYGHSFILYGWKY